MTKRQQLLLRWLDKYGDEFNTTLAMTTTATVELAASGAELDWLAVRWSKREGSAAGPGSSPRPPAAESVGPVVSETTATAEVVQPAPHQKTAAPESTGPEEGAGAAAPPPPTRKEPMATDIDRVDPMELDSFTLDQRRAKAYAESGYWPDAASVAKALVKIEAGRSLGLPAIVAMSEVHVIEGKPTLGAGALSTLVKRSGRYDFRVIELTNELCRLRFYDTGESVGESVFTRDDARTAGLLDRKGSSWERYPRNMLFARAMTNGVAWFAPDAIGGRFYATEEMQQPDDEQPIDVEADEVIPVEA